MSISIRRGLTAREILSVLTDIPGDVYKYGDKSCCLDADDDFISPADESSSSTEDENVNVVSMQCEWSCNVSIFVFFQIAFVFLLVNQDSSISSLQSDLESAEEDGTVLTAKDGTKWKKVQVGEQSTGRLASHNILKECPGPSSCARRNIQAASPASAWLLFIDKFILKHIRKCTITEAHRQTESKEFCLTNNELLAFIAVMYARGVTGSNDMPYHTLQTENWGVPLCKKTISRNRFSEILRFLRFDTKSDRSRRVKTDRFALFLVV